MEYFPSIDRYIDIHGIYTDEDLDHFDKLKKEWQDSLPKYKWNEYVEMFPSAKPIIKQILLAEIEKWKSDLKKADEIEKEIDDLIYRKCKDKRSEWFWNEVKMQLYINPLREGKEQLIKRNLFRLEYLKDPTKINGAITDSDVQRAKEYPITEILQFNRDHKTSCRWHKEKSASLHYYPKTNTVKCFGCGKFADSIAVCMEEYKLNFIEAVKKLSK